MIRYLILTLIIKYVNYANDKIGEDNNININVNVTVNVNIEFVIYLNK